MIKQASRFFAIFTLCFGVLACTQEGVDPDAVLQTEINNISNPEANVFVSGQPSQAEISSLANLGVRHVINLRTPSEQDWDEGEQVASSGMNYYNIPVAGASGITEANANLLDQTLQSIGSEPVLIHCSSGNRVGALVALQHGLETGDIDAAISRGNRWGLTELEPVVRQALTE